MCFRKVSDVFVSTAAAITDDSARHIINTSYWNALEIINGDEQ